jgi:Na+/proline symporter
MFSVAILDFVQLSVIIGGLLYIAGVLSDATGGVGAVISHARDAGRLDFFPPPSWQAWIPFIGAGVTMMLGSIPQQDVFQRITNAKDEKTAVRGSLMGAALYFVFCFVPCSSPIRRCWSIPGNLDLCWSGMPNWSCPP